MEHRTPRAFPTLDGSAEPPPTARRPLGFGRAPVRLRPGRVGFVVAVGLILLGLGVGWGPARHWLYTRDVHRLPFEAIELAPPPPPWIKADRRALLRDVREQSGSPAMVDALEVDLTTIRKALTYHCPWIRSVGEIRRAHPNRLIAQVEFREPIAQVTFPDGASSPSIVDAEGVVLPGDLLDKDRAGPLIRIRSETAPARLRPGETVKIADGEGLHSPDPSLLRACELAARFREWASPEMASTLGIPTVIPFGRTKTLWVEYPGPRRARWGPLDEGNSPGEPGDEEKWRKLAEWVASYDWPLFGDREKLHLVFVEGQGWSIAPVKSRP